MTPERLKTQTRRGATAVELAIVAPILMLFVVATLELWRVNMIRFVAQQAAYQASRQGVVPGVQSATLEQAALDVMATVGAVDTQVDIQPPVILDTTDQITVTVNVPVASNGWIIPYFYQYPFISGRSTLTRETLQVN
jgi:Flp pilus assembly protein TadG